MSGIHAIESGRNLQSLTEPTSAFSVISLRQIDTLKQGLEYIREEGPKYRILPDSHTALKVRQYGTLCDEHTFQTIEKGNWRVTVYDPEGKFNQAYFTTPPEVTFLAQQLTPLQRFRQPPPEDTRAQKHTAAQLFLAENTSILAEHIFCQMGIEKKVTTIPLLLELWSRPDLTLFIPDPLLLEIGLGGKFGKVERYVDDFERVYPSMKGRVQGAVVHYTVNEEGGNLRIFTSSPYTKMKQAA